jgi:hypothetical protein
MMLKSDVPTDTQLQCEHLLCGQRPVTKCGESGSLLKTFLRSRLYRDVMPGAANGFGVLKRPQSRTSEREWVGYAQLVLRVPDGIGSNSRCDDVRAP